MRTFFTALRYLLVMTILTGLVYPLLITGVGKMFFARQAEGSLIKNGYRVVGSELVGQRFTDPKYFWPRPSAVDYNPLPSGGSNLGPTSSALRDSISARRSRLVTAANSSVPADLLCASGSGLDPDISPEAARFQVERIANNRRLDQLQRKALLSLVEKHTELPAFGILGQPRVNVLKLNLALDSLGKM